jgi:hypothetical protein
MEKHDKLFPNTHLYCFKAYSVCFTNSERREHHKLFPRLVLNILLFQILLSMPLLKITDMINACLECEFVT